VTVMDSLSNGSSKDVSQSLHESTSKIAVVQSGGDLFKLVNTLFANLCEMCINPLRRDLLPHRNRRPNHNPPR